MAEQVCEQSILIYLGRYDHKHEMFCVKIEILIFPDHVSWEGKAIGSICPFIFNLSLETEGPINFNFC